MAINKLVDSGKIAQQLFQDNWPIRRRWLRIGILSLSINAEAVLIHVLWGGGSPMTVQIFMTLIAAIMSIFMFYVFGAVYDDHSKRRVLSSWDRMNDPYSAPPSEEDDE